MDTKLWFYIIVPLMLILLPYAITIHHVRAILYLLRIFSSGEGHPPDYYNSKMKWTQTTAEYVYLHNWLHQLDAFKFVRTSKIYSSQYYS